MLAVLDGSCRTPIAALAEIDDVERDVLPDESDALQAKYDSATLPAVLIFDGGGQQVRKLREFTPPDLLLPVLQNTR